MVGRAISIASDRRTIVKTLGGETWQFTSTRVLTPVERVQGGRFAIVEPALCRPRLSADGIPAVVKRGP